MGLIDGVVIDYDDGTSESFEFQDKKANEDIDSMMITEEKSEENVVVCLCENNKFYSFTNVTEITMEAGEGDCHGFITFGASAPIITVSGFSASSGDDITEAAAGEVWEFSVYPHNGGSYIIWKNWSED